MERGDYKLHSVKGYLSTLFIIEYQHGMLLPDCGAPGDVARLESYCREVIGRPMTDIKLAMVSHMHPDHAGGAHLLRGRYGIPLAAHYGIDGAYPGFAGLMQHKLERFMTRRMAQLRKMPRESLRFPRMLHPDYRLYNGDPLPFFEDWQAFWIPGHTMFDMGIYHPSDRILYVVDMFNEVKGRYFLPFQVLYHAEMEASIERVSALGASKIMLAHGIGQNVMPMDPEQFLALRDQVWLPPNRIARYVYRRTWLSPVWRDYRRQCRAEGKPVMPRGFFHMS
ncbi:MAG: MBL fold metallo-hydrolase [Syntrophomonadaceae bacterium]|nr:MBL fold metallo-hydrolase [Syntrophomonadaceae bacterium]